MCVCNATSLAQQLSPHQPPLNQPSGVGPVSFTRVDQTVADVDPLRVSFRYLSTDLRQPTGFRDVFRLEGSQTHLSRYGLPSGPGNELLARIDGAVTAVFPQSVYVPTQEGVVPLIPAGTVFFIGGVPSDFFAPQAEIPPSPTLVNSRVDQRVETPPSSPNGGPALMFNSGAASSGQAERRTDDKRETTEPAPLASRPIMTDEPHRRSAVRELIMKAATDSESRRAVPRATSSPDRSPAPPAAKTPPENKAAPAGPEREESPAKTPDSPR